MTTSIGGSHSDATRELQCNKMNYCMHKDDVVIGLGRATYGINRNSCSKKAYPSVLTTLRGTNQHVLKWYAINNFLVERLSDINDLKNSFTQLISNPTIAQYAEAEGNVARDAALAANPANAAEAQNARDVAVAQANDYPPTNHATPEQQKLLSNLKPSDKIIGKHIQNMLDFHFVGISLGTAYAHAHSGDTVASVMVGGLKTILNGAYQVHTNDLLMFYFDEESIFFDSDGSRAKRSTHVVRDHDDKILMSDSALKWMNYETTGLHLTHDTYAAKKRKVYHAQEQGTYLGNETHGSTPGKDHVGKVKPYLQSKHGEEFPNDKRRVFGRAISNAQPYEMLDIVLSRQSI